MALLVAAVFSDKWVNLHFHQIVDHQSDSSAQTRTYAVEVGPERARQTLLPLAYLSSLIMLATLAYALWGQQTDPLWQWLGLAISAGTLRRQREQTLVVDLMTCMCRHCNLE